MPWATIFTVLIVGNYLTTASPVTFTSSPIINQPKVQNETWYVTPYPNISTVGDEKPRLPSTASIVQENAVHDSERNAVNEVQVDGANVKRRRGKAVVGDAKSASYRFYPVDGKFSNNLVKYNEATTTKSVRHSLDGPSTNVAYAPNERGTSEEKIGFYFTEQGPSMNQLKLIEELRSLQQKPHGASQYDLTRIAETPSDLMAIQLLVDYSSPEETIGYVCWYDPDGASSPTTELQKDQESTRTLKNIDLISDENMEISCPSCEVDDDDDDATDNLNQFGLQRPEQDLDEGAAEEQLFIEGMDEYLTHAHLQKILQSGLLNADTFSAEDRRRRPLASDEGAACKCQVSQEETLCTRDNAFCDSLPGSEVPSGILEVSGTNISYLGVSSLLAFHNVSVMKLANNELAKIDPGTFSNMTLLRNLSLSYNHLTELHPDTFLGASNLRELLVSFNKFRMSLRNVTLALRRETTPNLVHLSIGGNFFPRIKRSDMKPLASTNLKDLQLHENGITELEPDAFVDLLYLSRLRLRHNPLDLYQLYLMLGQMRNSSLTMIDLSGLGRYSIISFFQVFKAVAESGVSTLQLNNYCFYSIMKLNFPVMSNIRVLSMSDCGLHTIYANTFDRFPALEQLILTDNRFGYIPSAVVLPNLVSLDISRTTFLPDVLFKVYEYQFRDMTSLRYLDISMNNIQILGRGSFYGLENLTTLVMNDAEILYIEEFTFSMLENLTELYLSRNPLDQHDFQNTWSGLTNLKVLFLDNCSISKTDLYLRDMPKLELIKMSSNRLHNITDQTFRGLKNLRAIDLSFNEIEPWHTTVFYNTENLTRIYLHNNQIGWVTESMVTDFRNTRVITLRENPYLCDCMLYYWLLWEERGSRWNTSALTDHTSDVDQCTCHMPPMVQGMKVQDFYLTMEHSPCKHPDTNMLITMIPVFLSGFLVAVLGSILWRNRWYLRYWIFKLRSQRWLKRLRGRPAGYLYDAFVSYSNEDGRLVQEMMDQLERHPPYYRLCVYERDFEIGNVISECILESINTSRKTILVLSDHFAKSNWCRWEMSLVQCRLFEQKRDDLIIVKLGKLRSRHLTPTIKYLMRTRIYIEWGPSTQQQMLFWEKLRAALRQPSGLPRMPRTV